MATAIYGYCLSPHCKERVPSGYCTQHQQQTRQHARRHHSGIRGVNYGRRWRKLRALYLGENPWCVRCEKEGREVLATDVHHVNRHEGDFEAFWNGPFEALCKAHHSRVTAGEVGWRGPR